MPTLIDPESNDHAIMQGVQSFDYLEFNLARSCYAV
jgi:hypothetical protein